MTTSHTAVVTLPADDQILITRDFAAPPHLVFRAYTEPDLIRRWWAGEHGSVRSVEVDLRVGGTWRYVLDAKGGFEVAFHGEFSEIVPGERLVTTEVFEGMPDAAAVDIVTFADDGAGGTTLTVLVQHSSREDRDAHIGSGMEGGMQESYDALDRVAASLG